MPQLILLVAAFLVMAAPSHAEVVRYTSDQIPVTLRSGPSTQNRIVRMLDSGTEVKVLKEDEDSGYSLVQAPGSDQSGWVLSRYLMTQPSARNRLAAAEKRLRELETKSQRHQEVIEHLTKQQEDAESTIEQLRADKAELLSGIEKTRKDAAKGLALLSQFKALEGQRDTLRDELKSLRGEYETLQDRSQRDWFLAGGGVLFAGILLGLLLPRLRIRRKARWDTL